MCKFMKWDKLKSTYAAEMLRGSFPKCGIKYTGKYGKVLVLVKYDVTDKNLVIEKAKAASDDGSIAFIIPPKIAKAAGI